MIRNNIRNNIRGNMMGGTVGDPVIFDFITTGAETGSIEISLPLSKIS